MPDDTLAKLEAPFDKLYQDPQNIPYVKAADVVHRLNVVLGLGRWHHTVLRDGFDTDADTFWCYGALVGIVDGEAFRREAYGASKIKRSKSTNLPLDYGNDQKAAQTDSLKKCAKQIGVAAYLDDPEERALAVREEAERRRAPAPARPPTTAPTNSGAVVPNGSGVPVDRVSGEVLVCADCGNPLETIKFASNTTWDVERLATESRRLSGNPNGPVFCRVHFFARRDARARDTAAAAGMRRAGHLPPEVGG